MAHPVYSKGANIHRQASKTWLFCFRLFRNKGITDVPLSKVRPKYHHVKVVLRRTRTIKIGKIMEYLNNKFWLRFRLLFVDK